ncbi:hypothetical protein ACHAXA_005336 [Cyclostephanos tholiformis]|uniref:Uncharacterized protein n=1 Tax=Cyclostephanos tholiformis TaxID=382380 RepID=A0ABD3RA78_9STRA
MSIADDDNEYVRLKLKLAQARAATDTLRLKARQLLTQRDVLREDTVKDQVEGEEQQRIIQQTQEANEKLRAQIKIAQEEKNQLLKKIEESNNCR